MVNEEYINNVVNLMFEGIGDDKFNVRKNGITFQDVYNGVTLYHRPKDAEVTVGGKRMKTIDSIFTYGFNREFTGSNGGNMYGAGVYTVYNLKSSNEKATGYGSAIIKIKLIGGYQDFLIFSQQLAKETYGNRWYIKDQIVDLFPKDVANKILSSIHLVMHDDRKSFSTIEKSSIPAKQIVDLLGKSNITNNKCRGIIYNGGHDGACCFVMDFSSVIPVAVSYDNGKTWKNRLTQELIDWISNEVDTTFQFGGNNKFKEIAPKAINGFTMVWDKNSKVNYIPVNSNDTISDVWFDDGSNWEEKNGILFTIVQYSGYTFKIVFQDNQYMVYDEDWQPLDCTVEELPKLFEE